VIVADFDAHLEDVAKDWRNVGIFRTVDSK
jgi:hypothetical protein